VTTTMRHGNRHNDKGQDDNCNKYNDGNDDTGDEDIDKNEEDNNNGAAVAVGGG
jgi:hypothetical protein